MHEVVGQQGAAVTQRLIVDGGGPDSMRQIAAAAPTQLLDDGLEAAAGVEYIVHQQQPIIGLEPRHQIVKGMDAYHAPLPLAAHVGGSTDRDMIGMDRVVLEHFLDRDADG